MPRSHTLELISYTKAMVGGHSSRAQDAPCLEKQGQNTKIQLLQLLAAPSPLSVTQILQALAAEIKGVCIWASVH